MFITVMFGAGCRELVNPWCSLLTLTAHLKQRGQVPPDATIALLAEDGQLVSLDEDLQERTSPSSSKGSPLLQERGTYVLVKIIRGKDGAPTCYESLLDNLDDHCPELAEELRWLSGIPTMVNGRRRRMGTRHSHRELEPPSRAGRDPVS
uniref:Chromosome 22 open reading frame 15 n=1 Tax=Sciurus vulgaris TaxID=55149 RepID=A0A8D2B401_SCIVU